MRNIKRIICLLLACVSILTFGSVSYAKVKTDVAGTPEKIVFAKAMGIIGEYDAEKIITVGELAEAINIMSDNKDMATVYFNQNKYAKDATFAEALAAMIDIAGYGKYTEIKHQKKTMTTYRLVAKQIGLLDEISASDTAKLCMADLVTLCYNLLRVEVVETMYSDSNVSIEVTDRLYMNDILDLYIIEGIVEETSYTAIKKPNGTLNDTIVIGGKSYTCGKGEFEDYIGYKVRAYVKINKDVNKIIALLDDSKTIEIAAGDISHADTGAKKLVYYDERGKAINVALDARMDVIYNFSMLEDYTDDDFKINQGRLFLIDNDEDGAYEVVKIEEYQSMKIYASSVSTRTISDSFGMVKSIDDMVEYGYPIYDEGVLTDVNNIPSGKIATMYENKLGQVVRIYTTSKNGAMTIDEFDYRENIIKADGVEYKYTEQVKGRIEKMKTGDLIEVAYDYYGAIAYFRQVEDKYMYGFLISFTDGDTFENPRVKIYTETGDIRIFETGSKINLNGTRMSSQKAFEENYQLGLWDQVGKKSQLVKYRMNADGVLTVLMTELDYDIGDTERPYKYKSGNLRYFSKSNNMGSNIRIDENTKVFQIPEDLSFEKRFKFGNRKILTDQDPETYSVYDVDDDYYAGVVVMRVDNYGKVKVDTYAADILVVDEVGEHINDLGDVSAYAVVRTPSNGKKEIRFNTNELYAAFDGQAVYVNELKRGDVIQIQEDTNSTLETSNLVIRFRNGSTKPYEGGTGNWYSYVDIENFASDGYTFGFGKVKKLIANGLVVNNKPEGTADINKWDRVLTTQATTAVFIVDNDKDKLYTGHIGDVAKDDDVFIITRYGKVQQIIVYKGGIYD